jgi:hypothetical protein
VPKGTTYCPECGKETGPLVVSKGVEAPKNDVRRRNLLTAIVAPAVLAFAIATFQLGYTSLFIIFTIPALAFGLVYVWEKNRGLKPGWEFIALSAVGTYAGAIFGWLWVLIPVLIYFVAFRYWLNRKEMQRRVQVGA